MSVLLGVNAFPARGDGGRRQAEALAAWRGISGVQLANLQWADDAYEVDGFETVPALTSDSRTATGLSGRRLPLVSECFDRLAELARRRGLRWFAYANSDIAYTQAAVGRIVDGGRQGYAFCRMDFDPQTGEEVEMVTAGVDAFAIDAGWWRANRHRFRPYIGGEPIWDNVYAAILLAHGDAELVHRAPLVRHERHPAGDWRGSAYAPYLHYLAALDRPYFTLWATWHHRLLELRARGSTEAEEMDLQREVFGRRPSVLDRAVQAARAARAKARWLTRGRTAA